VAQSEFLQRVAISFSRAIRPSRSMKVRFSSGTVSAAIVLSLGLSKDYFLRSP
jgi:hypothetical protein